MLATIQKGTPVAADDPLVMRLQRALNRLKPVCRESTAKTAAEIDKVHSLLTTAGVRYSELSVATSLVQASAGLPDRALPTDCAALLAVFVDMAEQGS